MDTLKLGIAGTTTFALLIGLPLSAQLPASTALKFVPINARYTVNGEFQGESMAPWESVYIVKDTTIDGRKQVRVIRQAIRSSMNTNFESGAVLDPASGRLISIDESNNGHQVHRYRLSLINGRLQGNDEIEGEGATKVDQPLVAHAIPDFALAALMAARPLAEGDTLSQTVFTFGDKTVRTYAFTGKVRSGSMRRAGAAADEAVWIVEGKSDYPAKVTIAKSDRRILEVQLPQGTVGSMTDKEARE